MQKFIISLICCLLPAFALADSLAIRENAPDRYVVTKGDTLWDISAKFFKDPWKWPQVWGLNKDTIKNPHWIYPGDVVVLDRTAGTLKIEGEAEAQKAAAEPAATEPKTVAEGGTPKTEVEEGAAKPKSVSEADLSQQGNAIKLSPAARTQQSDHDAIPSIPLADIKPFLSKRTIIEEGELNKSPVIIAGYEGRILLASNDIAYVKGLPNDQGVKWQIYRAGKALIDPTNHKILGHEAIYLGDAQVEKFDAISTLRITKASLDITVDDHLIKVSGELPFNYIPRAPESAISARIISIIDGISMAGQHAVVILNKGSNDGVENGHVLAVYRKGADTNYQGKPYVLPNMRYGLLFVFRTYKNISYALVMQTRLPVELLDVAQTP